MKFRIPCIYNIISNQECLKKSKCLNNQIKHDLHLFEKAKPPFR